MSKSTLSISTVRFITKSRGAIEFQVVHNFEKMVLSMDAAIANYSARADEESVGPWDFCRYVTSKDPVNILCIPADQYNALMDSFV